MWNKVKKKLMKEYMEFQNNQYKSKRLNIFLLDLNNKKIIENIFNWYNNKENKKFLHYIPFNDLNSFQYYLNNFVQGDSLYFIATLQNEMTEDVVCCCRLFGTSLAWTCNPMYRNCGYMTEMLETIVSNMPLNSYKANIDIDNIASQKVAEKIGFIKQPIRQFLPNAIRYQYIYKK